MDPLVTAASKGDIDYLKKASLGESGELSLNKLNSRKEPLNGNFIRRAVKTNHYTFLSEALKILPPKVIIDVVCQTDKLEGSNSLHYAAKEGNIFTVKLLVNAYVEAAAALEYQGTPPWLIKNNSGNTALHSCFTKKTNKSHEYVARYLVSRDHDLLRTKGNKRDPSSQEQSSTMVLDKTGASVFFCAMREGFPLLAQRILTSGLPYSFSGAYGENPLHHASKCNEEVSRLLLERHPDLIRKEPGFGGTVLDKAVEDDAAWLVKLMLIGEGVTAHRLTSWNKACRRLIWHINPKSSGDTPLHIAARKGNIEIAKLLIQGYEFAIRDEAEDWDVAEAHLVNDNLGVSPLHIENSHKEIPLIVALKEKHDDLGLYILSITTVSNVAYLKDEEGKTAYEIAVTNGCKQSSKTIIEITIRRITENLSMWRSNDNILHPSVLKIVQYFASLSKITPDVARLVVETFPIFEREPQKEAKVHLKEAAEKNEDWLVKLLLEGDSSLVNDSTPAWQIACEKGHLSTLLAFLEHCHHQEFIKLCENNQQTPLHHIKLLDYEQYVILMANPVIQELKNQVDSFGATPLHRAIEQKDYGLVKALLETGGIKLDIQDQNHRTVLDLLEEKLSNSDTLFRLYKKLLASPLMTEELKNRVDNNESTALHRAIERNDPELTLVLLKTKGVKLDIEDRNHKTALDLLQDRCVSSDEFFKLYKYLLANSIMTNELKNRVDNNGATSLHRAIEQNVQRLVTVLVETKGVKLEIKDVNGKTALDLIEERCSSRSDDNIYWYELYKNLLENTDRLHKMKNRKGSTGATPLHIAIEWDDSKLAKTLVQTKGIELSIEDTNGRTALDLIEYQSYQEGSAWYELYKELLYNPIYVHDLKNRHSGANNETPLHRAIRLNDSRLAKELLETEGVELDIKDTNGKTALDLLDDRYYSRKWGDMCREIRLDPRLKFIKSKYLQRRTSLMHMQNTLSVVAALLATITFAAGFTVPGGVDKDGSATLGAKAAFLVFSIANTVAMCSSMVVLFSLTGAMIWEAHPKATILIDFCVFMLQVSLCGTIVAFMTGVYAMMAPMVMWAAILVIILCSLAFSLAFCVLLYFWPILYMIYIWLKTCVSHGRNHSETSQGYEDLKRVANTNNVVSQDAYDDSIAALEHRQLKLENTNEEPGLISDSQGTPSDVKIDVNR